MRCLSAVAGVVLALVIAREALVAVSHLDLYLNPIPMNVHPLPPSTTIGWYFIYPPSGDRIGAPFSEWKRGSNEALLHSEQDCEENWRRPLLKRTEEMADTVKRAKAQKAIRAGLCVANTDPRFKVAKPAPWNFH
jgi:hypothetical protein